jgi:enediyne core biosynthesis thioesterase
MRSRISISSKEITMLTEVLSQESASLDSIELQTTKLVRPIPTKLVSEPLTFQHSIDIYLKESNAYGNTYFARYFEWQGICRERWFHRCIAADLLQSQGVFITKRAHQDYMLETFPFQTVDCEVNTFEVKSCSFYLLFRFLVEGSVVSRGYQQIVFATHDKRIQRLPAHVLKMVQSYEVSANDMVV